MQFSRRWSLAVGVMLAAGLAGTTGAWGAIDLNAEAAQMEGATGAEALAVRSAVLAAAPSALMDKNDYGRKVAGAFSKELSSKNVDAQVNTAILFASLQTLSLDSTLEGMLKSGNPAVRYWGAKGLGDIMDTLKRVGGSTMSAAEEALMTGMGEEKSGIVKRQMVVALGKTGDAKAVLAGLTALTSQLQGGASDVETMEATGTALSEMDQSLRGGSKLAKGDEAAAAKGAAWSASFAAQEQVIVKAARASEGSEFPKEYGTAVAAVVNNAVKVLNDLAGGGSLRVTAADESPEGMQFGVDALVGSAGAGPGDLQKVMSGVPVPPAVGKKP